MYKFYINCIDKNGPLVLFMPAEEFEQKGGLTEPWGSIGWVLIESESKSEAKISALKTYTKLYPNARLAERGIR